MKQLDHLSKQLGRRTSPGKEVDTKMKLVQAARGRVVVNKRKCCLLLPPYIYIFVHFMFILCRCSFFGDV